MASPTVTQILEIVKPETSVDRRIEALGELTREIVGEEQRDRMEELLGRHLRLPAPHQAQRELRMFGLSFSEETLELPVRAHHLGPLGVYHNRAGWDLRIMLPGLRELQLLRHRR